MKFLLLGDVVIIFFNIKYWYGVVFDLFMFYIVILILDNGEMVIWIDLVMD